MKNLTEAMAKIDEVQGLIYQEALEAKHASKASSELHEGHLNKKPLAEAKNLPQDEVTKHEFKLRPKPKDLRASKIVRWAAALAFATAAGAIVYSYGSNTNNVSLSNDNIIDKEGLSQSIIDGRFRAALVYLGTLDYAKINDNDTAAFAFNDVLRHFNYVPTGENPVDIVFEQKKSFIDFIDRKPTPYALEVLKRFSTNGMSPIRLEEDLRSKDEGRIRLAQNYMSFLGKDVLTNGILDAQTIRSAHEIIREPLTIPEGLINENGEVQYNMLIEMAKFHLLYLPENALTAQEKSIAQDLPLRIDRGASAFYREKFIALRLIADNPSRYLHLVCAENQRRLTDSAPLFSTSISEAAPVSQQRNYSCDL